MTGIRATRRAEIEARLLDVGRRHLASHGAAALSVRAVARDMEMAPSALFRYITGRDDLLTLLIVDAYTSLGDRVEAAVDAVRDDGPSTQWDALARAVRAWAVEHPHQWALLYGSPVPDYAAPGEVTTEPGTRVPRLLAGIGADAARTGQAGPALVRASADGGALTQLATAGLMAADDSLTALQPATLANGLVAWMLLVGAVSTEVFEGFGGDVGLSPLFDYTVEVGARLLFGD